MDVNEKIRAEIVNLVSDIIKKQKKQIETFLEKPPQGIKADLALPCFVLGKELKKDPNKIAEYVFKRIKLSKKGVIKKAEVKGPYINFYADWDKLGQEILETILKEKDKYGCCKKTGKKILIEHTSANPDGPLHIGHFRNSVIGDCLVNMMKFLGYKVRTISFLNDTGRQMAIIVMEYMKLRNKHPDKKPDWWVLDLYVNGSKEIKKNPELEKDIKDIINRFESGDRTLIKIFSSLTNECIKGHKQTLSSIGIKIDQFFRESKLVFDGSVNRILNKIKKLPEGKIEGKRIWVNLKGIEREFTLTRADGTSLYPARDLAFHEYKFSKADFNINVIGTDHRFYFKQLVPTLGLLFPDSIKKYKIVFYEFLLTPLGTMSTRLGKFVSVDELVDKVIKTAGKVVEEKMPEYSKVVKKKIAELVGMGALKYAMLRVSPEKTYSFNIKDILSFEGNTAPYIQYTYVRACSILRKGKVKINKFDAKELKNENERLLIKQLSRFPVIVRDSATAYKPHYIASYVYELATMFNEFYHSLPVLKAEKKLKTARLALVESVSIVLKNALGLLGIKAPERM